MAAQERLTQVRRAPCDSLQRTAHCSSASRRSLGLGVRGFRVSGFEGFQGLGFRV